MSLAVIFLTKQGALLAERIRKAYPEAECHRLGREGRDFDAPLFTNNRRLVFIGSLGVCVRLLAPHLQSKHTDPAVVCLDEAGRHCIAVLSGHVGGANAFCRELALRLGAAPVLTTSSDVQGIWTLDTLGRELGWRQECKAGLTQVMALWAGRRRTALVLECGDAESSRLAGEKPDFADLFFSVDAVPEESYDLVVQVGPSAREWSIPSLCLRPPCLSAGLGCNCGVSPTELAEAFAGALEKAGLSPLSLANLASVQLKQEEPALLGLAQSLKIPFETYSSELLEAVRGAAPSERVRSLVGIPSVCEAAALQASGQGCLLVSKQVFILASGGGMTLAVALRKDHQRRGRVYFVGAGPGAPSLMTVRARELLAQASLVLFAGSLVPVELTAGAPSGCVVRSSADMDLREQVSLMAEYCQRGLTVVRLHTGDPSLYGAIQEQMEELEALRIEYEVVPGVSAFQAAAARLRRELTAPELVQTVILTRAAGKTPVPESEELSLLASHKATLCIYLSIGQAESIQERLLCHYAPDTPVAICHRVSWPEERIIKGRLGDLAALVREHQLVRTTLIMVSPAFAETGRRSYLYAPGKGHGWEEAPRT